MDFIRIGLLLSFVGGVLLGLASQFGLSGGYGGPIVWKKKIWKIINILGWCLLAIGFLIQFL